MLRTNAWVVIVALSSACLDQPSEHLSEWGDERPTFEEWLSTLPRHASGRYYVEGDILTRDMDRLHRLYDRRYPPPGTLVLDQILLIDNKWSASQKVDLTYCISNNFVGDKNRLVDAIDRAAAGWEAGGDVDFKYLEALDPFCTSSTNVVFNVRPGKPASGECTGEVAAAFFPSDSREEREIYFCEPFLNDDATFQYAARHELGHALGFLHEFNVDEVAGGGTCEEGDGSYRVVSGTAEFGGADPRSVMTYFSCPIDPDKTFTDFDMQGVGVVYQQAQNYDVAPADYDGDGVWDMGVRAGRGGNYFIRFNIGNKALPAPTNDDGTWDFVGTGYGSTGSQVAPGNYDGGAKTTDIGVKFDTTGVWCIDYFPFGTGTVNSAFDECFPGYGGSEARVTPADYDGDGITDLSVKSSAGAWHIDYSNEPQLPRQSAVASSQESPSLAPQFAIDGNPTTRWSSQFTSSQSITIDLGSIKTIKRVRLSWEAAYATAYKIQLSSDAVNYVDVASVTNGDGGLDEVAVTGTGRWVRMRGITRATQFGYSLFEFEVFGPRFGLWNLIVPGYGDNASAIPVPADYDGDTRADLAVKTTAGDWFIDFSNDFGAPGCVMPNPPCFGTWNLMRFGAYGNATFVPAPADYDGDGKTDLATKGNEVWWIDFAANGFAGYEWWHGGYGDASWKPIPGKYHRGSDKRADIATKRVWTGTFPNSEWYVDLSPSNGLWNFVNRVRN